MSKSITRKCSAIAGVAGAKLKCPNPAPWIWITGSPSPEISYQSSTPLTCALPVMRTSWFVGPIRCRQRSTVIVTRSGGAASTSSASPFGISRRTSEKLAGLSPNGYGDSRTRHGASGSSR